MCTWFIHKSLLQGWPKIDKDRIKFMQEDRYSDKTAEWAVAVDGLRTMGITFLHEVGFFSELNFEKY